MNPPQYMTALETANRIRLARADMKRDIRSMDSEAGARRVSDLLMGPVLPACDNWQVIDLLIQIPYVGRRRATRMLLAAGVRDSRPIGRLTPRQLQALALELQGVSQHG